MQQADGSWLSSTSGETRWQEPSAMAAQREAALQRGADVESVHEELQDINLAIPPEDAGPRYELRIANLYGSELLEESEAAAADETRTLYARVEFGLAQCESTAQACPGVECSWSDEVLQMQVDELTWLGADVTGGGGQKRKRAEVRLSVWKEQAHQDVLIGKAAVPESTVRSALEARQLISVDIFASKKSTVKTGVLDLSLKVERFANAAMMSRRISGGWEEGDDAAAKYDNDAWLQVGGSRARDATQRGRGRVSDWRWWSSRWTIPTAPTGSIS